MILQDFITKYTGKKIDFDGSFGAQCMDLYRFYVKEVWGVKQTPGVIGAYQVFGSLPAGFDKFTTGTPQVGDVITWSEKQVKFGHIAIVTEVNAFGFKCFEQNAPIGGACRIGSYNYKNIIGWFRPKQSLNKTFMKITIIANKISWPSLQAKVDQLKQKFITDSTNKFEPVFEIKRTNFDNIPLSPFKNSKSVDINWYRNNITPLATGEATLLLMNPEDYPNGLTWGFMTYGDSGKPVRIEVSSLEINDDFVQRAFHEISHALLFLSDQPDVSPVDPTDALVHYYLYQNPQQFKQLMDYIDWPAVQRKLATIKPPQRIKVRQVGWTAPDPEKGLYVPFDSLESQAIVLAKINEVLPNYELDTSKEYNLGKRPF